MKLDEVNVLFFPRAMGLGGTENVVLQLCEIFKDKVNKIVVCSSGGINVKKLEMMGIRHYKILDIDNKSLLNMLNIMSSVSNIIRNEEIDIVHTHHRMAAFYINLIAFKLPFLKIVTAHNTFKNKKLLTKFAYRNTHVVACGKMVKKNLVDYYGLPDSQVTVIRNAIKPFEDTIVPIDILSRYRVEGYFLVGNVGRLSEQKGMEYYIQAALRVLKESPMTKFFIIGDGECRKELENMVYELKLQDKVIFLGYRNDIQNIMSQLDLIILSSLWEGLPLTPIEAFSVGKTIVATAVDGTIEIVEDGVNGALIEAKDSNAIADKILELQKSLDKIKFYEENGYKKYREEFSYQVLQKKYSKYYRELME